MILKNELICRLGQTGFVRNTRKEAFVQQNTTLTVHNKKYIKSVN